MSLAMAQKLPFVRTDRKSTRLNSSHTEIYTLSLHDALPICPLERAEVGHADRAVAARPVEPHVARDGPEAALRADRSEEHTSELQSHRDLHSFPTRRSSDLSARTRRGWPRGSRGRRSSGRATCRSRWPRSCPSCG